MSVSSRKIFFSVNWRLLGEERIANIGTPLEIFMTLFYILKLFCSVPTSLLCIMEELAGRGGRSVAVADTGLFFLFFGPFLSVSVHFGISATIHTRPEFQCLPFEGFFPLKIYY